jgi:hypothetical protein
MRSREGWGGLTAIPLLLALLATPALPAPKKNASPPRGATAAVRTIPGTVFPCDPLNLIPGCKRDDGSIFSGSKPTDNPIASILQQFAAFIDADNVGAINLSQAIKNLPDGNGYVCWTQMRGFSEVVKAHPIPLTFKLQSDIEAARLLMMAANKVCGNSACQQVNSELKNGILAALPINAGISLPFDLNNICSKIPQVAQVPLPADAATIPVPVSEPMPPPATPPNP